MSDEKPSVPIIIKTEAFSPAINKLVMSNGSTMYGCTWPGCNFTAEAVPSVGSHYKAHSGQAAQRRRGERKPRTHTKDASQLQRKLLALLDEIHNLINEVDSWEEENQEIKKKADAYDAIKGLLE